MAFPAPANKTMWYQQHPTPVGAGATLGGSLGRASYARRKPIRVGTVQANPPPPVLPGAPSLPKFGLNLKPVNRTIGAAVMRARGRKGP